MNFRGKTGAGDLSGFLDVGSHFEGELRFEQSFRIDGKVVGKVISDGDLVVGEKGEVVGEVRVARLFVSGRVEGEVRVAKRLSIHPQGRVEGEVRAAALVIEEGGALEGSCTMQLDAAPREAPGESESATEPPSTSGGKVVGRIAAKPER